MYRKYHFFAYFHSHILNLGEHRHKSTPRNRWVKHPNQEFLESPVFLPTEEEMLTSVCVVKVKEKHYARKLSFVELRGKIATRSPFFLVIYYPYTCSLSPRDWSSGLLGPFALICRPAM